jgi:hypothetical protein
MCVGMSSGNEDSELIRALCTRAGMIMEDAASQAIILSPGSRQKLARNIEALRSAAADCQALLTAAVALARRS